MAGLAPILKRFREIYPGSGEAHVWRAPGRVNLIGEHTDYNLGLVLPMAIQLECRVAAAPSADGFLHVYSDQLGCAAEWRVDQAAGWRPRGDWSDRAAGIGWELARRGVPIRAQNVLIQSTVPMGGGLSSSAALGVALAMAFGAAPDPLELAQIARAAEMNFVGVPCGIMDQFVATHGRAGAAILLDCRSLQFRAVELPEEIAVIAANSMVKHEHGDSAYRLRVQECAEAARSLGVENLRDVPPDGWENLTGISRKRAGHVVRENARVEEFASAVEHGDCERMGRVLLESHRSLRDDYEVSCAELDFLVETAMEVPGVLGARMTGGGFGGSTITLARREAVPTLEERLRSKYMAAFGRMPQIHICTASDGASQLF